MRISDWSSDVCSSDLELIQAYVGADLDDALGNGTDTKIDIGSFTMDLGSRRLVGQNNFRNTTNAFAGGRLQFNGRDKEALTLFYTLPLQRLPDDKESILDNEVKWDRESFDLVFWGGFLNKPNIIGKSSTDLDRKNVV